MKWINVEKKLPNCLDKILMCDENDQIYLGSGVVLISNNQSPEPKHGVRTKYTHWMPLPSPPTRGNSHD